MIAPTLTTERLTLRPHRQEDFPAYAALWARPEARFMGGPLGQDEAWCAFCSEVASWGLQGFGHWVIEETATGTALGVSGLGQLPSFPERELGWVLYPDYRSKGYATEAARAARDFAFSKLGFDTLVSYVSPENTASIKVAERLGARRDMNAPGPDPEDLVFRHPKVAAS